MIDYNDFLLYSKAPLKIDENGEKKNKHKADGVNYPLYSSVYRFSKYLLY